MGKREEDQGARLVRCALGVLLGGLLALGVCLLFLLGASAAVSGGLLGMDLTYQITIVGCVLGGFFGGLLAAERCGGGGLAVGLLTGGVLFLLLLTLGALCFREISLESGGIGLLCGALCGGAAAGLVGKGSGSKRRKKRRRH